MFEWAIWFEYSENISDCSFNNYTYHCEQPERQLDPLLLSLSLLALGLNATCMSIFAQQNRRSVMRISLLLLSATEVVFHLFFSVDYAMRIAVCSIPVGWPTVFTAAIASVINLGGDAFICTRNWCNVLITAARTEVIVFPLRARRYFTRRSTVLVYIFFLSSAFCLAFVRAFQDYARVCPSKMGKVQLLPLLPADAQRHYEAYGYFVYQIILPILLVLIMSIIICTYVSPWCQAEILKASTIRRRHQMHATRTVLLIAFAFLCFQMPSFIFVILYHYTGIIRHGSGFRFNIAQTVADTLIVLDSIVNILIYTFKIPGFRHQLYCARCCRRHADEAQQDFITKDAVTRLTNNPSLRSQKRHKDCEHEQVALNTTTHSLRIEN